MRALVVVLALAAGLVAATTPEPPRRGKLDDLRSDAIYLLEQSDGVRRVERLVAPRRPAHRITHICDYHWESFDDLVADLRDQDPSVTDDYVQQEYSRIVTEVRRVQRSQRKLLRWLAKYEAVEVVFLEGLTPTDMKAYATIINAVADDGYGELPLQLGAAAQAIVAGELYSIAPVEDEDAFVAADPFAGEEVVFDSAANDAREAAIVRRLVNSGPLSVVILGGAHDLSRHVEKLGDTEYLRVFVDGYPVNATTASRSADPFHHSSADATYHRRLSRRAAPTWLVGGRRACPLRRRPTVDGLCPSLLASDCSEGAGSDSGVATGTKVGRVCAISDRFHDDSQNRCKRVADRV